MIEDTELLRFYINLTLRKREVLQLVTDGLRNRQIAERLSISGNVVAEHLTGIYGDLTRFEEFSDSRPNRLTVIRTFVPFFIRHPELRD